MNNNFPIPGLMDVSSPNADKQIHANARGEVSVPVYMDAQKREALPQITTRFLNNRGRIFFEDTGSRIVAKDLDGVGRLYSLEIRNPDCVPVGITTSVSAIEHYGERLLVTKMLYCDSNTFSPAREVL